MRTILLVDDDDQLRSMFATVLTRNGYRVTQARSGVEGLALAHQHLPELILTDVHMPNGDGLTLLRDIRRDAELRSRQVVMMTGRPDLVPPRKGMEEGADDFLLKPVSLTDLMNCIEARFRRSAINWRVEDERLARLRTCMPPQLPHELFTPLAGIIGLLDLLRGDPTGFSPEEIADIYRDMHLSAWRLHRTLRNYLLVIDPQTTLGEPTSTPLPPRRVQETIQAAVQEVLLHADRAADITLTLADVPLLLTAEDLRQIVSELVDNACSYSRLGTPVHVDLRADGTLAVRDDGRGMTEEEINHIGIFRQFDRSRHEQQGLGLGLMLVQRFATFYGADFHLTSKPGQGTTATVRFRPANGNS